MASAVLCLVPISRITVDHSLSIVAQWPRLARRPGDSADTGVVCRNRLRTGRCNFILALDLGNRGSRCQGARSCGVSVASLHSQKGADGHKRTQCQADKVGSVWFCDNDQVPRPRRPFAVFELATPI
jgi:hypothetical protein